MRRRSLPLIWLAAACTSLALGFGFTVDDALISARVAHHIATVGRYAFNAEGPTVDCVTPLGWAWLLAPFSTAGAWQGMQSARLLGVVCALGSGWLVGDCMRRGSKSSRRLAMGTSIVLATSLPFGAWTSSGMETGLAVFLSTLATWGFVHRRWCGPIAAGLAAAMRPELTPWAAVFALLSPLQLQNTAHGHDRTQVLRRVQRVGVTLLPTIIVIGTRVFIFGAPAPLALLAKPSDANHGVAYAWGAVRLMGFPLLWLGWRAWGRVCATARAAALALAAHTIAVVGVGGDWMSLFRLFVPILPTGLWLGWAVLRRQPPWFAWSKVAIATAINVLLLASIGPASRQIVSARRQLIFSVSPYLLDSVHVAALDVGWVGAATAAPITDLAGVTDPEIAPLPGGHTSKRLPRNLLERRGVDTLVILLVAEHPPVSEGQDLSNLIPAREVERALKGLDGADAYHVVATLPLQGTTQSYVVMKRALD
jgi:hypothetical protein